LLISVPVSGPGSHRQAPARPREAEWFADAIEEQRSTWLDAIGQPRKDAAVRQLVSVLPAQPVIDVAVAQAITGKSHVAICRTLQRAEEAGNPRPAERT
jgi:hypothetical protein